jgi:hypothetical protein
VTDPKPHREAVSTDTAAYVRVDPRESISVETPPDYEASPAYEAAPAHTARLRTAPPPGRPVDLGATAVVLTVVEIVLVVSGSFAASGGLYATGAALGVTATILSVAAVVAGVLALATNRGRLLAGITIPFAVAASPWILTALLGAA